MIWIHANKFNNLYKISKFVEKYKLVKLTPEEEENMNKPITNTRDWISYKTNFLQWKAQDET